MKRRPLLMAGVFALLILAGAALFLQTALCPEISVIDPATPSPDTIVSVIGHNFGSSPGELLFDSVPLQEHLLQVWSPSFISFRMPNDIDSALVRVRLASGLVSNPLMIADIAKVPVAATPRDALEFHPNISTVSPASGLQIGKLISIRGSHFGDPEQNSALYFSKVPSISTLDTGNPNNFIRVGSGDTLVERWGDGAISVRVPSGAENGYVFVRTKSGTSNTYPVSISRVPGKLWTGDSASYAIEDSVNVRLNSAAAPAELSMFLPLPAATQNQNTSVEIERGGDHLGGTEARWQEFRFGYGGTGAGNFEIARKIIVDVSEIRADIATGSIQSLGSEPPRFLLPYLTADALVPSDDPAIVAAAATIRKKDKNTFRQIALAAQWTYSTYKLSAVRTGLADDVASALASRTAGFRALAFIDCAVLRALGIPAEPVSGFLVGDGSTLIPHYWAEYYILGIGWISCDPALATGNGPAGFKGGFADRLVYYRGIDDRHIAMARGYQAMPPVQPDAKKKSAIPWSFFDYDEVSRGASYTSTWAQPRLLAQPQSVEPAL